MNKKKWRDPSVPLPILALKLAEEAGEVANAITDDFMTLDLTPQLQHERWRALDEELDHAIFIAETMKSRIRLTG